MKSSIIDIKSIINSKNKSSNNWEKHNFLFEKISNILKKKISEFNNNFKNILLLSSDAGEALKIILDTNPEKVLFCSPFRNLLDKSSSKNNVQKVESHFNKIPCKNSKFDLIISNLCLHSIDDKKTHFESLHGLLNEDGLIICNFFSGETLKELRHSLYLTDEKIFKGIYMRIPKNIEMIEVSDILAATGFKELVSEKINYKIYYQNVRKIIEDLKGTGDNCLLMSRVFGLITNNYINTLNEIYKNEFQDLEGLKLNCDIVSVCGWKNKKR